MIDTLNDPRAAGICTAVLQLRDELLAAGVSEALVVGAFTGAVAVTLREIYPDDASFGAAMLMAALGGITPLINNPNAQSA